MNDYAKSMEKRTETRKGVDCHDPLTKLELKQYRKYTGQVSWLPQGTRLDWSYFALVMSKKNATATIADLHNINTVLEKVNMKESQVCYGCVGKKKELKLIGIGDASYKMSEKAVGGTILLLADNNLTRVSPLQ